MGRRPRRGISIPQALGHCFSTRRLLIAAAVWCCVSPSVAALNTQQLEPSETAILQSILKTLDPVITAHKQDGTANILTWEALYQPLNAEQRAFLDACRLLKAEDLGATSHHFGENPGAADLVPVGTETILKNEKEAPLDPQYLPRNVLAAYQRMMTAMKQDLGKRLLVESGYRSPAYQLYLFMYFTPKHGYSIKETNRFVALPGYSEHGAPAHQAIDFINEAGINGEDHPEEFEALPEYRWLQEHANTFGFVLSYPRGNALNTSFEPWHWHFEGK